MKLLTTKSTVLHVELAKLANSKCVDLSSVGLSKLLDYVEDFKPDIFWVSKWPNISIDVLKGVKQRSSTTKIIQWYGDFRDTLPKGLVGKTKYIDLILLNNKDPKQRKMYLNSGIKLVGAFYPSYFPTEVFHTNTPECSIIWGGNHYGLHKFPLSKFRYELVTTFNKNFDLHIFGNGWGNLSNRFKFIKDRVGWARALCSGLITLGANHYCAKQYYDRRLFDCMASGRLHLTHYVPGMEQDFEHGKDIIWFKTIDEAVKLTEHYVAHPDRAHEIGLNGLKTMLAKHSWEVRAKQFLNKVSIL